jgi:hypothetical protein
MNSDLNELAAEIHAANSRWWHDLETGERLDRNKGEMLMLVVSELAEALEGERKSLRDDHLPERMMAEVELADVKIRVLDFAGGFEYELIENTTGRVWDVPENKGEALLQMVIAASQAYTETMTSGVKYAAALSILLGMVDAYAEKFGYDVDAAMAEKRAYNITRKDHQRESRLAAGGKKF